MKKTSLTLVLFIIHFCSFSQEINNKTTSLYEQILLQTNTNFYLSGESILYKTISINESNKTSTSISKIVYVELVNNENNTVIKNKQIIKNSISYNDFFIPTTIETGSYKVIAYTNLTKNNNEYASKDIFIYNPYLSLPEKFKEKGNTNERTTLTSFVPDSKTNSNIETNKKEYQKREKVSLKNYTNLKGNFILNVIKVDSIPNIQETNATIFSCLKTNTIENNKKKKSFPETRGEIFTGKIISKNNTNEIENKKIALSIPGEYFDFKITSTDKNGNFKFLMENVNGEDAYFQILEKNKENYKIELTDNPYIKPINPEKEIKINPNYATAFLKKSIANQIQNIYYHTKSDTVFAFKKSKPFYNGSDKEYYLKDYNPQNTVKEIFIEIIPEVYIHKKDGRQIFSINDYEVNSSDLYFNTIVLVDGFLLQDYDELLTFDPAFFTKINFVNKGYLMNNYLFNGVVNLTTKDFNYIPKIDQDYIISKKLERPQLNKKYFTMDYSKNNFEKIPDYRYQLCWEPNLTEISTTKPLEFYTSDISGNFKIIIEGITDNGEPILMENYIYVK